MIRKLLIVLGAAAALLVLLVGGYAVYLTVQYERIPDGQALEVAQPASAPAEAGTAYTAVTWNVGFGAYNRDFSFFMDSGTMADGTAVRGTMSRAADRAAVEANLAAQLETLQPLAPDFLLLQEVDTDADRSYHVDMASAYRAAYPDHGAVYASNFHSAYLFYPVTKPHGRVQSGLLTLSSRRVDAAERRSYPVDESFPTKFFDLDRCFAVLRLPVDNGRELVLVNSHMSAYDEGGTVRAAQMDTLCAFLAAEYAAGNYVVVGGDFNHALGGTETAFPSQQQVPEWVYPFDEARLPEGFRVVTAANDHQVATCRSTDLPYTPGVNYTAVLDGFLASDNVLAGAENLDAGFAASDHNPVLLRFTLLP